mmetsp:Transcript_736/g.1134  ORF Transcript_736/g.1134 Transcript_736/m.1134 type:complete len:413 (+) Transcript_736:549-1787(+)|eukprot:CAMPEP_0195290308 /NCGR_PEP_ID=MMETSP0707-20130614/6225_1 /TAXON_ID=33640 /ORGANISM="Asterionellopsis glacialis, Strain CCMP134" /LENGTH=412 /DNA_ID=CAMNT_0040350419 /DNA_START=180 /DNA_END=1418 /DNA_ORIENTATION=+
MNSLKRTRPLKVHTNHLSQQLLVVVMAVHMSIDAVASSSNNNTNTACSLVCFNGGTCHSNNNGDLDILNFEEEATLATTNNNNNTTTTNTAAFDDMASVYTNNGHYEHSSTTTTSSSHNHHREEVCVCPLGFTGLFCEIVVKPCYHFLTRTCWNGQPCVEQQLKTPSPLAANGEEHHVMAKEDEEQTTLYHCECASSQSNFQLDPLSQQRYCTQNLLRQSCTRPPSTHQNNNKKHTYYCYNGGQCAQEQDEQKECVCSEGWKGTHCQYTPDQLPHLQSMDDITNHGRGVESPQPQQLSPTILILLIGGVLTSMIILVGGAVYYYYYDNDDHDDDSLTLQQQPQQDATHPGVVTSTPSMKKRTSTTTTTTELELADLQHTLDADGSSTLRSTRQQHHHPNPHTAEIVRTSSIV